MVNKVFLLGRLGHDPEVRTTQGGHPVCSFSLATSRTWKDRGSGVRHEETEWHQVVAWGALAEAVGTYLAKGSAAFVEGRNHTREWEDEQGRHRRTEVVAEDVRFLDRATGREPRQDAAADAGEADAGAAGYGVQGGEYGRGAAARKGGGNPTTGNSYGGGYGGAAADDDIPF